MVSYVGDSNCTVDGECLGDLDVLGGEGVAGYFVAQFGHPDHLVAVYDWEAEDGAGAEARLLVHTREEQRVLVRVLDIQNLTCTQITHNEHNLRTGAKRSFAPLEIQHNQ